MYRFVFLAILLLPFFHACQRAEDTPGATTEPEQANLLYPITGSIERLAAELDDIIDPAADIEILARGFNWSEGPLWLPGSDRLIFSDVPENTIYQWQEGDSVATVYLRPSGFTGEATKSGEPGSNGLALDADGQLILCQHGDRRIARMQGDPDHPSGIYQTLVADYRGQRFNSPNDLAFHPINGDLYFTDPPYGLPGQSDSPEKELTFHGVFRVTASGDVTVMDTELTRPNGIAFSPDGRQAYVANSDPAQATWYVYDLDEAGNFTNKQVLFDATSLVADNPGLPDGLKVNRQGILFATGPGGVHVLSPSGQRLGLLRTGRPTANVAFGPNEETLYLTADDLLLRVALR